MLYKLTYYLSFFKSLTINRLTNLFLLKFSYYISLISRKNKHWGMPTSISIEPTTSCNLHCPECPSGLRKFSRPTGYINDQTIKRIIEDLSKKLIYVTFYFQGEPLLHPKFGEYIKQLKTNKIVTATSTNAHFLTEKKGKEIIDSQLDRLIVSVDGADAETYLKYRKGGDYETVIQNIEKFVNLRKTNKKLKPLIELQFIVFKHNEHQIDEIKKLGKKLGVDMVTLKTAQIYEFENGHQLMPGLIKYARYEQYEEGKYRIKGGLPNHCYRSWSGSVITWDGSVVPCCFDKDADFNFGNLHQANYPEIQKSIEYQSFRKQILTNRSQIDICRNCTEGVK